MENLKVIIQVAFDNAIISGEKFEIKKEDYLNLIEALRKNDQIIKHFDNTMMNTGSGFSSISIDDLAQWLLKNSYNTNPLETISSLENYINSSYTEGYVVFSISGLYIQNKIKITDEIDLIPFDDLPSSNMKEELSPQILKQGLIFISPTVTNYKPPKAALIKKVKIKPKYYLKEENKTNEKFDISDLIELCTFLTLHDKATPINSVIWTELESNTPCKNKLENTISFPSYIKTAKNDVPFYHWFEYKDLYKQFLELESKDKKHLLIPLQRLNTARQRDNYLDKAIDQGIAIEALFLNGQNSTNSFLLSLRAAHFLGENIEEKKELFNTFKLIYSCRSAAVHTGSLEEVTKRIKKQKLKISEFLDLADELCIKAIKKIITNGGFPDWENIILS